MNISQLSKSLGVTKQRIKREFIYWCEANGLNYLDFFKPTRYELPEEFIKYIEKVVELHESKRR